MAMRSAIRFSLIMSTRFSPSTYSVAEREASPSGFRSGLPPSWLIRSHSRARCSRLAREPGRARRVELVAQDAHDLRGHGVVQQGDGVFHLAAVVLRDGALRQVLLGPAAD